MYAVDPMAATEERLGVDPGAWGGLLHFECVGVIVEQGMGWRMVEDRWTLKRCGGF